MSYDPNTARLATRNLLTSLNRDAIEANFNRSISDEAIEKLDPNGLNCLIPMLPSDNGTIRSMVLMKFKGIKEPQEVFLDVRQKTFDALMTPKQYKELKNS